MTYVNMTYDSQRFTFVKQSSGDTTNTGLKEFTCTIGSTVHLWCDCVMRVCLLEHQHAKLFEFLWRHFENSSARLFNVLSLCDLIR